MFNRAFKGQVFGFVECRMHVCARMVQVNYGECERRMG